MKKLLVVIAILLTCNGLYSQGLIEVSYGFEDRAVGGTLYSGNLLLGAEHGVYRVESFSKIKHAKYKTGYVYHWGEAYKSYLTNHMSFVAVCYNNYNIIYNIDDKVSRMPKWSVEFGLKTELVDGLYCGFNYDVIQYTGSFTLGLLLWK